MRSQDSLDVLNHPVILACMHRKINIFQGNCCARVQHNLSCYGSLESQHSDKHVIPYKLYWVDNNPGKYLPKDWIVHADHRNPLLLRVPSFLYSIGTDNFRKSVGEIWKEIHVQTRVFLRGIISKPSNPFPVQLHSKRHIPVKQQFKVSFSYFAIIHEFSLAISSFHCPTVVKVHQGLFRLL